MTQRELKAACRKMGLRLRNDKMGDTIIYGPGWRVIAWGRNAYVSFSKRRSVYRPITPADILRVVRGLVATETKKGKKR